MNTTFPWAYAAPDDGGRELAFKLFRFPGGVAIGALLHALSAGLAARWGYFPFDLHITASFGSGLLLGWPGVLGCFVGQATYGFVSPSIDNSNLSLFAVYAIGGAIAAASATWLPGFDRRLGGSRAYLHLLASAVAACLAVALVGGLLWFPERLQLGMLMWFLNDLMSVLILVPLLGLLPEALQRGSSRSEAADGPASGKSRYRLWPIAALLIAITALSIWAEGFLPPTRRWLGMLYLLPIFMASRRFGVRGGLITSSLAGVLYLTSPWLSWNTPGGDHWGPIIDAVQPLVFAFSAVALGSVEQRLAGARRSLETQSRLLDRNREQLVEALAAAIEAKDGPIEGHLRRVAGYAVLVGERLGVAGDDLEALRFGGLLHDIGKIGIPEAILRKPGPLDPDERWLMERHPEIGVKILDRLELLAEIKPMVLQHQERWDGNRGGRHPGYPQGLAGEEICLGARIIAVVDAYDAMTSDRPYRDGLPQEEALSRLGEERGRQFDPRVVDAFREILTERPWPMNPAPPGA